MKKVYIILTNTGTILSKLVRCYTRKEYGHVSISLDRELSHMYSFGRLKPTNPFIGGFVHESTRHGTFFRFKNTTTSIYSMEVTDEQYSNIKKSIINFKEKRRKYKFNVIGLFAVAAKIKYQPENSFYCAEFVKEVLNRANVENSLPNLIKPEDFKNLGKLELIYKGFLREYTSNINNYESIIA